MEGPWSFPFIRTLYMPFICTLASHFDLETPKVLAIANPPRQPTKAAMPQGTVVKSE